MTQEDKELLLQDLSARLSYEVKVDHFGTVKELLGIIPSSENVMVGYDINDYEDSVIEDIKPYLRPMSSMTEEEAKEISILYGIKDILSIKITDEYIDVIVDDGVCSTETRTIWYDEIISSIEIFDWLNKHHFDYRDLIEKGLAIEAPEGMYNIK